MWTKRLIKGWKTLMGPSKKTVELEILHRLFTESIEQDRREREDVRARLRAIEAGLPSQYHFQTRKP